MGEICTCEVLAGDLGVVGVDFERDDFAVGWESAGEPDSAVACEGANFENASGVADAGEEVEEFTLRGGDGDLRETCGVAGGEHGREDRIAQVEFGVEQGVDGGLGGLRICVCHVVLGVRVVSVLRRRRSSWCWC